MKCQKCFKAEVKLHQMFFYCAQCFQEYIDDYDKLVSKYIADK